jgi:hypothetical protein
LKQYGGVASEDDVMDKVAEMMSGVLTEMDRLNLYGGAIPRWRNQANHMLEGLIEDRYITRRGVVLKLVGNIQIS